MSTDAALLRLYERAARSVKRRNISSYRLSRLYAARKRSVKSDVYPSTFSLFLNKT